MAHVRPAAPPPADSLEPSDRTPVHHTGLVLNATEQLLSDARAAAWPRVRSAAWLQDRSSWRWPTPSAYRPRSEHGWQASRPCPAPTGSG